MNSHLLTASQLTECLWLLPSGPKPVLTLSLMLLVVETISVLAACVFRLGAYQ